jgi:ankyrin repeat protein
MDARMLERIAAGRTDLAIDWIGQGGAFDAVIKGASLLQWCAYFGDVATLRHLLDHGAALAELGANLDLNGAAFHGHWQLCEFLIAAGADANAALPDTGETPLHAALCRFESLRHEQVAGVLLAAGADPNRATVPGVPTGCFMRDVRTRGETPLHRAAAYGTGGAIRRLIEAGANREARDANGDSPLGWASWALRAPEILRLLCFGEYHIHPEYRGMEANLIGGAR